MAVDRCRAARARHWGNKIVVTGFEHPSVQLPHPRVEGRRLHRRRGHARGGTDALTREKFLAADRQKHRPGRLHGRQQRDRRTCRTSRRWARASRRATAAPTSMWTPCRRGCASPSTCRKWPERRHAAPFPATRSTPPRASAHSSSGTASARRCNPPYRRRPSGARPAPRHREHALYRGPRPGRRAEAQQKPAPHASHTPACPESAAAHAAWPNCTASRSIRPMTRWGRS